MNWWIDGYPHTVFAMGGLEFYGRTNARARGERYDYERYTGEAGVENDPFVLRLDNGDTGGFDGDKLRSLYLEAEAETGYIRDRNVFGEGVSIEDTMAVMAPYDNGVILNYSLVAYSPWEGFRASITGNKGRIEIYAKHRSHIIAGQSEAESVEAHAEDHEESVIVFPMFGQPYRVDVPKGVGDHGGGDPALMDQLFSPDPPADPFNQAASHLDGAASLLIGVCANESISTGRSIHCREMLDAARPIEPVHQI